MAPRSLWLWSASQMVTPGLASTKPLWLHFTWGRISTRVCPGLWSYPTLTKLNDSSVNVPCGGSPYPFQGHSQIPASPADRIDLFPSACRERAWTVGRSLLPRLWRKGQGASPSGWGPLAGCCPRLPGKAWEGLCVALTLNLTGWSGLAGCYSQDPPPQPGFSVLAYPLPGGGEHAKCSLTEVSRLF